MFFSVSNTWWEDTDKLDYPVVIFCLVFNRTRKRIPRDFVMNLGGYYLKNIRSIEITKNLKSSFFILQLHYTNFFIQCQFIQTHYLWSFTVFSKGLRTCFSLILFTIIPNPHKLESLENSLSLEILRYYLQRNNLLSSLILHIQL